MVWVFMGNNQRLPSTLPAFLWHFIAKQKWQFIVLFVCTSACVIESNVIPYVLKLMVNTVTRLGNNTGDAFHALAFPICFFVTGWSAMILIFRLQEWVYTSAIPRLKANMRMALFDYAEGHSYAYFADNFAGSIASKISDVPRSSANIIDFIRWRILTGCSVLLVAIAWLSAVSMEFSLVLVAWVGIHITISYLFARTVSRCSRKQAEDLTRLHGHIVDSITNMSAVRLFARRECEITYIRQWQDIEQESSRQTAIAMLKARAVMDTMLILMFTAMLLLLANGWQKGWVNAGDVVFVMFTVLNVMRSAWQLGTELPNFFNEIGILDQALTLITRPQNLIDARDAKPLFVTGGEISFDNVRFQYSPGMDIFRDKNITISSGEKVGLVGFSGSGKSTFVNLILRLYDVENGCIRIDGQDIAKVTQDSLHGSIAMIPQDSSLFHRTLMENIRYGRTDATDAEVISASKKAHCHEFISQLKDGYDSLVGERGIKLSGGQRQRIAIARAILKNAPILILDEATSSLDSITEKYIQDGLDLLMSECTTIVIAHRLSTLANMDRILVFNNGSIIEDGTHESLLAGDGHYARLWDMQAGGFLPD